MSRQHVTQQRIRSSALLPVIFHPPPYLHVQKVSGRLSVLIRLFRCKYAKSSRYFWNGQVTLHFHFCGAGMGHRGGGWGGNWAYVKLVHTAGGGIETETSSSFILFLDAFSCVDEALYYRWATSFFFLSARAGGGVRYLQYVFSIS